MRVMVLGGTGFVGPCVVRRLAAQGHAVGLVHRGRSHADLPPEVEHLHGDWEQLEQQAARWRDWQPEVVLVMVPIGEEDSRRVVSVFTGQARRLVGISSMDVYRAYGVLLGLEDGPPTPVPLTEDAPLRQALHPYRAQAAGEDDFRYRYEKILAERVLMGEPDLPGTILRLPAVLGPGDRQHRLLDLVRRMDDGREAILLGAAQAGWRWQRGYVEDMAAAITGAIETEHAAGRIYNVGEPDAPTEEEWALEVGRAADWPGRVVTVPDEELPQHLRNTVRFEQSLVGDTTRIRRELGYREERPRAAWLRDAVAWERAHPSTAPVDPARFDYPAEDEVLARWSGSL